MAQPAIAASAQFRFRSPHHDETLSEYTTALQTFRRQEEEDDALLDHLTNVLVSLSSTPTNAIDESECPTPRGRSPTPSPPPEVHTPRVVGSVPIRETPTSRSPGHDGNNTVPFRVGVALPKFAAINLNSLPRIPYESYVAQSLEVKMSEMAVCLDNLSSRLDSLQKQKSYAEVVAEKPPQVAVTGCAEEEGIDNGGRKKSVDATSEKDGNRNLGSGWSLVSRLKRRKIETLQGKRETPNLNLRGVETRKATWDIYLGNLSEGSKKEIIQDYLFEGGVTALQVFMLQSKVKDTVNARVRIPVEDKEKVLKSEFWPLFVKVRSWVFRPRDKLGMGNHIEVAEIAKID